MAGRKRTKRRNSDEDFDVDEEDGGPDNDDTNKWACHSCTFMNRAAAFKCNVCGTRKGTSTRRSRVNDNVVEMQKTITNMVQKQVEKEKSISRKRRERSLLTSMTRETSNGPVEIKQELPNGFDEGVDGQKPTTSTPPAAAHQTKIEPVTPEVTPIVNGKDRSSSKKTPTPTPTPTIKEDILSPPAKKPPPPIQPSTSKVEAPVKEKVQEPKEKEKVAAPVAVSVSASPIKIPPGTSESSILQHLPERLVKKINQPLKADTNFIIAQKRMTGIDPIVAEAEAVLLPQDWDRQKVMRGLVNTYVSPATSRQSSETDSSSSDVNRSFETPLSDVSPRPSKSCQIPDFMIHRDAPQKIFIVANGYPAYFEEFPRRIP